MGHYVLSSIGYTGWLADIPFMTDENAELILKIYPYSETEKAVFSKAAESDTLLQLNTLAKYLDRQYFYVRRLHIKYDFGVSFGTHKGTFWYFII